MMKADRARELTEKMAQAKADRYRDKINAYARRLTDTKIAKRANKGFNNCQIKVANKYTPTLVIQAFERMGYEVNRHSKNGRAILSIKW